ncbi:TolB family protein [Candidatus Poribacteria bacterium]
MPASGGKPILIVDNIGHGASPSLSPDGKRIVFERLPTGGNYDKDIWIVDNLPIP